MRRCEDHGISCLSELPRNQVLARLLKPLREQAEFQFQQTGQERRLFSQVHDATRSWDRQRRLFVWAEYFPKGPRAPTRTSLRELCASVRNNTQPKGR